MMRSPVVFVWFALFTLLAACGSNPVTVVQTAQTTQQKAFAVNEIWLSALTSVDRMLSNPDTPQAVRDRLIQAVKAARPAVAAMRLAVRTFAHAPEVPKHEDDLLIAIDRAREAALDVYAETAQ